MEADVVVELVVVEGGLVSSVVFTSSLLLPLPSAVVVVAAAGAAVVWVTAFVPTVSVRSEVAPGPGTGGMDGPLAFEKKLQGNKPTTTTKEAKAARRAKRLGKCSNACRTGQAAQETVAE